MATNNSILSAPPGIDWTKIDPKFTGTTPGPGSSGFTVKTDDELLKAAQGQIASELEGQINPLQGQVGTLQTKEGRVLGDLGKMFDTIQPSVEAAAAATKQGYDEAFSAEQGIFQQAAQRLNKLKQDRAQHAQALAQEIGGPVSMGEFDEATDPQQSSLMNTASGQLLHTLGYAQAGEQEAQAFAGRVFPLVRTEETAKARSYYEDKITEIQKEIAQLEGSKSSKVNARLLELQTAERTYALQLAQQNLDKTKAEHDWNAQTKTLANDANRIKLENTKANRDWIAAQHSLKNEDTRIAIAQKQLGLDTVKTKADIAMEKQKLTVQQQQFAQSLGLSKAEYLSREKHLAEAASLAQKKLAATKTLSYSQYLDAALNPAAGKTVTNTVPVEIDHRSAMKNPKDAYKKDGKWYRLTTVKQTLTTDPITDPGSLVDFLTAHGVPKKTAISMVKQRLRIPEWDYGEAYTPTAPDRPH